MRRFAAPMAVADVLYKVVAIVVLGPLGAILFRIFVAASGREVLADEDILLFFLRPLGWTTLLAVGGVLLATLALELAALMAIIDSGRAGRPLDAPMAIRFAFARAAPVLAVAIRLIGRVLTVVAPTLALVAVVASVFLGDHDINYYLARRPPELWYAAALTAVVLALAAWLLGRMLVGWAYALPLLLFDERPARAVLSDSVALVRAAGPGKRRIVVRLTAWLAFWVLLSSLASGLVTTMGGLVVPAVARSLPAVVLVLGIVLAVNAVLALLVSLAANVTLAIVLVRCFREAAPACAASAYATREGGGPHGLPAWLLERRTLLAGAAVATLAALTFSYLLVDDVHLEDHAEVSAHRGASAAAPENTLAAVERAILDGADWVEIDVQETADGEVAVVHDKDLMKLGGVPLVVADSRFAALAAVDIGSWFAAGFADERIPRLADVLALCKDRIGVNIELKHYGLAGRLEQRVAEIVEEEGMESSVVVMSLSLPAVRRMKALRPDWPVGLLTAVTLTNLARLDVDFLAVNQSIATRRFVRAAHRAGKAVHAWTVNDAVRMSALLGRGVDNIITDEPALAVAVLEHRRALGSAERLLVGIADYFGVTPDVGFDPSNPG